MWPAQASLPVQNKCINLLMESPAVWQVLCSTCVDYFSTLCSCLTPHELPYREPQKQWLQSPRGPLWVCRYQRPKWTRTENPTKHLYCFAGTIHGHSKPFVKHTRTPNLYFTYAYMLQGESVIPRPRGEHIFFNREIA